MPHAPGHRPQLTTGFAPGFANVLPDQSLAPTSLPSPQTPPRKLTLEELLARYVPDEETAPQQIQVDQPEPGVIGGALDALKGFGSAFISGESALNKLLTSKPVSLASSSIQDVKSNIGAVIDPRQANILDLPGQARDPEALERITAERREATLPFGEAPGTAIRSGIEGAVEDLTGSERAGKYAGFGFDVAAAPSSFVFAAGPSAMGFKLLPKAGSAVMKNPIMKNFVNKTGSLPTQKITSSKPVGAGGTVIKKAGQLVRTVTDPVLGGGNVAQRYAAETIVGTAAEAGFEEGGIGGGLLGALGSVALLSRGRTGNIPGAPQAVKQAVRKGTQKIVGKPASTGTAPAAARRADEIIADPEAAAKQAEIEAADVWSPAREGEIPPIRASGSTVAPIRRPAQAASEHKNFKRVLKKEIQSSFRVVRTQVDQINEVLKKFTSTDADGYEKVIVKNPDGTSEEEYLGNVVEFFDDPKYTVESLGEPIYNAVKKMHDLLDDAKKILDEHGIDFTGGNPAPLTGFQRFFPRRIKDFNRKAIETEYVEDSESAQEIIKKIEAEDEGADIRAVFANIPGGGPKFDGDIAKSEVHERVFDTFQEGLESSKELIEGGKRSAWIYDSPTGSLLRFIKEAFDDLEVAETTRNFMEYGRIPTEKLPQLIKETKIPKQVLDNLDDDVKAKYENLVFHTDAAKIIKEMFPDGPGNIQKTVDRFAGKWIKKFRDFNKNVRPILSTLDFSGPLVTLGTAALNPQYSMRMFAKDFTKKIGDTFIGKRFVDAFFNDPETRRVGRYASMIDPYDADQLKEFLVSAKGNKVRRTLGKATMPFNRNFAMMGNRLRRDMFNIIERSYKQDVINDMVDKGIPLKDIDVDSIMTEEALISIGKSVDRFTGIGTGKVATVEDLSLFAPNFYRSIIETIGKNFEAGTLEGDLARAHMQTVVSSGLYLVTAVALSQGRDVSEVLSPIDGDQLYYNDRLVANPNFGTVRVPIKKALENIAELDLPGIDPGLQYLADNMPDESGTRDVHVFGAYDSMARLASSFADLGLTALFAEGGRTDKAQKAWNNFVFATQTKGSPGAKLLMNAGRGRTFFGDPFLSLDSDPKTFTDRFTLGEHDSLLGIALMNAKSGASLVAPFTIQAGLEEFTKVLERQQYSDAQEVYDGIINAGTIIGSGTAAILSGSGLKENPLSFSEQLDQAARNDPRFNKPYNSLTPEEKDEVRKSNPDITKNFLDRPVEPSGKFNIWSVENNRPRLKEELGDLYREYQNEGLMSLKDLRIGLQNIAINSYERSQNKRKELGVKDKPFDEGASGSVITAFYKIMEDATNKNTNDLNFTDFDELLALLMIDIENGYYGNPDRAMEFIEERTVEVIPPELDWYFINKEYIANATENGGYDKDRKKRYTYWGQKDRAFKERKGAVDRLVGDNTTRSFGDMVEAYNRMIQAENNPRLRANTPNYRNAPALLGLINKIQNTSAKYKERMRASDPELKKALEANGYIEK